MHVTHVVLTGPPPARSRHALGRREPSSVSVWPVETRNARTAEEPDLDHAEASLSPSFNSLKARAIRHALSALTLRNRSLACS